MSKFATKLENALNDKGMTTAELSRKTQISESVICQYKQGKYEPKARRLQKIASVLDVSAEWLLE